MTQPAAELVTFQADQTQIERLAALGVLSAAQVEAGRRAGGLQVQVPAQLVADWQSQHHQIEQLARRIHQAGLARPARLFLSAGRPLSFMGSQALLVAQPVARLLFGAGDLAGRYSRLLEDRANLDSLLARLDVLEQGKP